VVTADREGDGSPRGQRLDAGHHWATSEERSRRRRGWMATRLCTDPLHGRWGCAIRAICCREVAPSAVIADDVGHAVRSRCRERAPFTVIVGEHGWACTVCRSC
jgi:hypothetical protein